MITLYPMCFFLFNMDMKEILDPKKLMIAVGVMVVIISCLGMANSEQWAEWAWDDEPIGEHDAAYEQMWALHMLPMGLFAIGTGLFVEWKTTSADGNAILSISPWSYELWVLRISVLQGTQPEGLVDFDSIDLVVIFHKQTGRNRIAYL